ncbi:hypothetical protein AcV7_005265 [Taiwanofungus camphoratus]|nr:hypothetical protein AcV7_005265 [Antrodia cinnamomea]
MFAWMDITGQLLQTLRTQSLAVTSFACSASAAGRRWPSLTDRPIRCLRSLSPSNCPLCRKAFQPDRIKKLHVDRWSAGSEQDVSVGAEESELLQRVAFFFGENSPDEDVNAVMEEAHQWLITHSDNVMAHRTLRSAVAALHRYKALQQESRTDKEVIDGLHREHRRKMHIKQQDLDTAHTIEKNLLSQMEKMEDDYRAKLSLLEFDLATLRAEHARPRPEYHRSSRSSNPLPQPPRPIANERLTSFARPYTSMSNHSLPKVPEALPNSNGNSVMARASTELTASSNALPVVSESNEELRRDRSLRPPVIVPGAPSTHKVIPPRPANDADGDRHNDDSDDGRPVELSSSSRSATAAPRHGSAASLDARVERRQSGSQVSPTVQYGYIPGQGYVWYQQPSGSSTSRAASTLGELRDVTGGQPAYGRQDGGYGTHRRWNESPVQEAERMHDVIAREPGTGDSTRGHPTGNMSEGPWAPRNAPTDSNIAPASNSTSNTNSMSSSSLRNMELLVPPATQQTRERYTNAPEHRDILDLLGVNTVPSQPSPASTWGTVHSSQVASRNSTNSSLGDLGLVGLPQRPDEFPPSAGAETEYNLGHSDGDSLDEGFITPREARRTLPHERPGGSHQSSRPSRPGRGLGLTLDSDNGNSREIISGQQDLHLVSQSLTQFLSQSSTTNRDCPPHSTRSVITSHPSDSSEPIVGARTGIPLYSRPQSRQTQGDGTLLGSILYSSQSRTSRHHDRVSTSDSEHSHAQAGSGHERTQSGYRRHQRHSSVSGNAATSTMAAGTRQPSVAPRISTRAHSSAYSHPVSVSMSSRDRTRSHEPETTMSSSAVDLNGYVPVLGQSSLLLSFPTAGPSTSVAVTGRGEDSAIHAPAPRPVNSRQNSLFNLWSFTNGR